MDILHRLDQFIEGLEDAGFQDDAPIEIRTANKGARATMTLDLEGLREIRTKWRIY